MPEPYVITQQILGCLETTHPYPEWSSFRELAVLTGTRRLDFWTMAAYSAHAYRAVVYEVKATRSDFLNELKHPEKRIPAEECAHECWFAVPAGIVKPEEIPANWGLMVLSEGMRFRRVKHATQREIGPLPHYLTSAVARRGVERSKPIDRKLWRVAGRDLTDEDVIKLAQELGIDRLKAQERSVRDSAVEDFKLSYEYGLLEDCADLARAVISATGARTVDEWRTWLAGRNSLALSYRQREAIKRARRAAGDIAELCDAMSVHEEAEDA